MSDFYSIWAMKGCMPFETNRVKSTKIRRFEAGSDLSLYPYPNRIGVMTTAKIIAPNMLTVMA